MNGARTPDHAAVGVAPSQGIDAALEGERQTWKLLPGSFNLSGFAMKTAPTIEIEASLVAMAARIVAGTAMTALFVGVACHLVPPADDVLDVMIGGVGSAGSLLFTLIAVLRLATLRGPIVTIAPHGIRDRRIAGEMVPWSAVAQVSTREDYRNKVMVLSVDPRVERKLTRTWRASMSREADRRRGADELCVTALGLRTSHETLIATTLAYLEAWRDARHGS